MIFFWRYRLTDWNGLKHDFIEFSSRFHLLKVFWTTLDAAFRHVFVWLSSLCANIRCVCLCSVSSSEDIRSSCVRRAYTQWICCVYLKRLWGRLCQKGSLQFCRAISTFSLWRDPNVSRSKLVHLTLPVIAPFPTPIHSQSRQDDRPSHRTMGYLYSRKRSQGSNKFAVS